MNELKELRIRNELTQSACAAYLKMPLRTYQNYENDPAKTGMMKYRYILEQLGKYNFIDEEHGILKLDDIRRICSEVFQKYDVAYCYLFGSYAKGKAKEESDVDLLIETTVTGLRFYELVEVLREKLKKKIDLLTTDNLAGNTELTLEILRDGVKIYGQQER